jgi:cytochrome c oxidase subunit 3
MASDVRGRPVPKLEHHFESYEQQRQSAALGMWLFLATEILFFGALFTAYVVYRWSSPDAFRAASHELNIVLGATNTVVLLGSSLTMVLAVREAQLGGRRSTAFWLVSTLVLGLVFLGIKSVEYHHKFVEHLVPGPSFSFPGGYGLAPEMFFNLYFAMTGLHALHMIIGAGLLVFLIPHALRGSFSAQNHNFIEGVGLYWHFVDIIWIFLFPLLYLVGRHQH